MDVQPKPKKKISIAGIIIGVIAITLIVAFVIIVFVISGTTDQPTVTTNNPSQVTAVSFLSTCVTGNCSENLVCDGSTFTCKLPEGSPCTDAADCANGLFCSGICTTGATGGLNNLCPCTTLYACVTQSGGPSICKGKAGATCGNNIDCVSDNCLNTGRCSSGSPNAFPCSFNSDCGSNNCNSGFCQPPGIITGTQGAACAGTCVSFQGAHCNSSGAVPLACRCGPTAGEPGTCVATNEGIGASCSSNQFCVDELVCLNTSGLTCNTSIGPSLCNCFFPYNNPNVSNTCIGGMSDRGSTCFNNVGGGCDQSVQCQSLVCGGSSVLNVYHFQQSGINSGINYINATSTEILPIHGPTGLISPYKLFAISNGFLDTLYVVDRNQGLLSVQCNPANGIITSPWVQLLPLTVTGTSGSINFTRTLIDVGTNGINFLVAYHETVTGSVTGTNDTVYIGPNVNALIPFNFQTGAGITGTQYTTGNVPLTISYIDISAPNISSTGGDALISTAGTIYIKTVSQTKYSVGVITGGPLNGQTMTSVTGPARFYFDDTQNTGGTGPPVCPGTGGSNPVQCNSSQNVSFIKNLTTINPVTVHQNVLQFSGNLAELAFPIDVFGQLNYPVFDYSLYSGSTGLLAGGIIMLTSPTVGNTVALSTQGNSTIFPFQFGVTARSVASANAFYVLTLGSCT